MAKTVNIVVRGLPADLRRELKVQAARIDRTMNDIIIELIREYVQKATDYDLIIGEQRGRK